MVEYDNLRKLVESVGEDLAKAEGGNKAAGTRVRKSMQDIKNLAQEVRKKILEVRSADDSTPPKAPGKQAPAM
ncbi:MAG: histone H1 [Phycisphaerae bacterium]